MSQAEAESSSSTPVASDGPPVPRIPPFFPKFGWIRVRIPITGEDWTIWPGPKASTWDWIVGFPLELHPFAWDYLKISCDGDEVQIQPHYSESTWDTFWTHRNGRVRAQALGGLFPFTLGEQVDLLIGMVVTLGALPAHIRDQYPDEAAKIEEIHRLLSGVQAPPFDLTEAARLSRMRRGASEFVWHRKLRRLERAQAGRVEPRS